VKIRRKEEWDQFMVPKTIVTETATFTASALGRARDRKVDF